MRIPFLQRREEDSLEPEIYIPDVDLAKWRYANNKSDFVNALLCAETDQEFEAQCTFACRAVHKLYDSIRALQQQDILVTREAYIKLLTSYSHLLIAATLAEPVGVAVAQLHVLKSSQNLPDGNSADIVRCHLVLHATQDAIDGMLKEQPELSSDICDSEGIPLKETSDSLLVHRLNLAWVYTESTHKHTAGKHSFTNSYDRQVLLAE